MLVVSTNVLAKHHESKTDEGQHFKKQRHKLLFSCRTSDKTWRQKCFKKMTQPFSIFLHFYFLWLFSTTFVTTCTKCPQVETDQRRVKDTIRFRLVWFVSFLCVSCLPCFILPSHQICEALKDSGGKSFSQSRKAGYRT